MRAAITITTTTLNELSEPEIRWLPWTITLLAGLITGATMDLFALWLFAQYVHKP
jgi:hypothetical protein